MNSFDFCHFFYALTSPLLVTEWIKNGMPYIYSGTYMHFLTLIVVTIINDH